MTRRLLALLLMVGVGIPGLVEAQRRDVTSTSLRTDREYWTSNRLRRAREMPLPRVSRARLSTLFGEDQGDGTEEGTIILPARSLQFSSSRLIPRSARTVYPYLTVGRLYFTSVEGNFVCTASVIANRLVLTAGHCVYDAVRHRFHKNFLFVPGYHKGQMPRGVWTARFAVVTEEWGTGNNFLTPTLKIKRYVIEERYRNEIEELYAQQSSRRSSDG